MKARKLGVSVYRKTLQSCGSEPTVLMVRVMIKRGVGRSQDEEGFEGNGQATPLKQTLDVFHL